MRTWLRIVAWIVGVLGIIALVLYLGFFDVWTVPTDDPLLSASIEPTLSAGDVVVVTRRTEVSRGNLLRCADPQAPGRFVIARAIASYGDEIEINRESISVDNRRNPSPRACDVPTVVVQDPQSREDVPLDCSIEDYGEKTFGALRSQDHPEAATVEKVQQDRWYLVSDDRHVHLDSRDFGEIDPKTCQHVVFRLVGAGGFWDSKKRLNIIW
jgi:signal peptidase I